MTFDPMKFYEDGKRRESRWGAVTPFILVGLLLLVMGVAGYFGYKGARPKHTLGSPAIIPYMKLKVGPATNPDGHPCTHLASGGWECGGNPVSAVDSDLEVWDTSNAIRVTRPRKHTRKADKLHFTFTPYPMVSVYEYLSFTNTVPAQLTCTRKTRTSGLHCDSRPLTPAEIDQYKPMTEKPQPSDEGMKLEREKASAYDELVLDHDQTFYDDVFVPGASCTDRERYRELQCVSGGKCKLRNKDANWCLDASVDGDVPRTKIVPDCLYGGSVDGSIRPCTADELKPTFAPSKPSCVMPADIDVCPVQMLDPKASHD